LLLIFLPNTSTNQPTSTKGGQAYIPFAGGNFIFIYNLTPLDLSLKILIQTKSFIPLIQIKKYVVPSRGGASLPGEVRRTSEAWPLLWLPDEDGGRVNNIIFI
jgi:hypothetical protein